MYILSLTESQTLKKIFNFSIFLLGEELLMLFIFLFKKQNRNSGVQNRNSGVQNRNSGVQKFFYFRSGKKTKYNAT